MARLWSVTIEPPGVVVGGGWTRRGGEKSCRAVADRAEPLCRVTLIRPDGKVEESYTKKCGTPLPLPKRTRLGFQATCRPSPKHTPIGDDTRECTSCGGVATGTFVLLPEGVADEPDDLAWIICEGCSCCDGQILAWRTGGLWYCRKCGRGR